MDRKDDLQRQDKVLALVMKRSGRGHELCEPGLPGPQSDGDGPLTCVKKIHDLPSIRSQARCTSSPESPMLSEIFSQSMTPIQTP